jgi:hypothetical protein
MGFCFVLSFLILAIFPELIKSWNLEALSGILVLGVPLEELIHSFTFGMMRSGVYEHFRDFATNRAGKSIP